MTTVALALQGMIASVQQAAKNNNLQVACELSSSGIVFRARASDKVPSASGLLRWNELDTDRREFYIAAVIKDVVDRATDYSTPVVTRWVPEVIYGDKE